ncbi:MAG: DUF642 domain-containing protein [Acidobacteria bacterium]|nr:DUF642 domain-containing protein [Acidobacteriota bacterium]
MKQLFTRTMVAAFCLALPTFAGVIISDNFEGNSYALNTTPNGWTVTGGTVDVIGPGYFNGLCANGTKCIDMDGSTWNAGDLSRGFSTIAGATYELTWDMNGNNRGYGPDSMVVSVGSVSQLYTLASNGALATYMLSWVAPTTGSASIMFSHQGGDNVGILLDNIQLTETASVTSAPTPEPGSIALMISGAVALLALRKKTA